LEYQAGQAQVWRDAANQWFQRESGIADAQGRVGHYPGRYEAESMKLDGYTARDIVPWEGGSGGKGVACAAVRCAATMRYDGAAGWRTIRVQYFDQMDGVSKFRLLLNGEVVDQWSAADRIPSRRMDSSSSTRRQVSAVALRPGDEIRIEGTPDGGEPAGLDYVEILP
jgi:alpha-glucuronidase